MPISDSQTSELQCHECHLSFQVDVWLIIDVAERTDLLEYCRDGSIHSFHCPNGHLTMLGVPLLLHDAERRSIVFSPGPEPSTPAQDQHKADVLINRLRRALPPGTDTEYLNVIRLVPRQDLPRMLNEEAQAAKSSTGGLSREELALMGEMSRPVRPEDIPRRIQRCEEALRRLNPREQPGFWGFLQARLGTLLEKNPSGDPIGNLERAIEARQAALTIYTRDEFPQEWANLQTNLGRVYLQRRQGDTSENIKRARVAFEAALTVFTREQFPDEWAIAQELLQLAAQSGEAESTQAQSSHSVGADAGRFVPQPTTSAPTTSAPTSTHEAPTEAMQISRDGDDSSVLGKIERCFQNGDMPGLVQLSRLMLQIVPRQKHPRQWAVHQSQLAYGLLNSPEGDRSDNIEQAIEALQATLTVVTRHDLPQEWADHQNRLGIAYAQRLQGDPQENWKKAIEAFENACAGFDRAVYPEQWAASQLNLARAYEKRVGGNRADNLNRAIQAYNASLEVHTRETNPEEWAEAQSRLGMLYEQLSQFQH